MARPYRANPLFRSALLQRGVALVAVVALAGTGIGFGYLALGGQGTPLAGTSAGLTKECTYDYARGGVVAEARLQSVNDGEVTYRLEFSVWKSGVDEPAAEETVAVDTPDGRSSRLVSAFIGMDQMMWDSEGYRACMLDFVGYTG
ncbi:MAG TPA: hypothetical protein VFR87_12975 [Nocardioidaceae bacterium]|nr:hypothetical protein [Nocardioidaceae bacterium]